MKLHILLVLLLATTAFAHTQADQILEDTLTGGYTSYPHQFGAKYSKRQTSEGFESIVEFPHGGLFSKEEHVTELLRSIAHTQNNKEAHKEQILDATINCEDEGRPDYFKFFPIYIGTLNPKNSSIDYSLQCFQNSHAEINIVNNSTVEIIHVLKKPKSLLCTDAYFYSTLMNFHVEVYALQGKHKVTFKVSPEELEQIKLVGIQIFRVCDKTINFIPDFFKTLWLFIGGIGLNPNIPFWGSKPTPEMIAENVKFYEDAMGYKWQKRPHDTVVELDESLISSGDFFAITRFDGLDPIIGYGSGSLVGHCVMAIRIKGEIYIAESQSGWYWPRTGIQLNPYKQWVKWARNAGFHVTWLPLKPEIAKKFDVDAAYKFFKTLEGHPYGFHNFLFGWLDTPDHNYPPVLSPEAVAPIFALLEKIYPEAAESIFGMAMNMRLNTTKLNIAQIAVEAAKRGKTFPDLFAMVEVDGWQYADGVSYTCSPFVIAMYKAAGLFGNLTVYGVEMTPRDLYMLDFFSPNPPVPENCKKVDPANPFCQIMGEYRMEFPGIGTVKPYAHMNEHCWTEGPEYLRIPEGC